MDDPLSQFISLLRPKAIFSKGITGAGRWAVRYAEFGHPSFCIVLDGSCRLAVDGETPITLLTHDFVLLPSTPGFTMSSSEGGAAPVRIDPKRDPSRTGVVRHGNRGGKPDVRLLGGYFQFDSPDAALIVSLLPAIIHARKAGRLSTLVQLVAEETSTTRAGSDLMLERLVEILLIEALRTTSSEETPRGLLKGLADAQLAPALRLMHAAVNRPLTVARLAKSSGLSRSAFFEKFVRTLGVPPMEYLSSWRMAVARHLLLREGLPVTQVAQRVGYSSSSTFSTAFARHVGQSPRRYARHAAAAAK